MKTSTAGVIWALAFVFLESLQFVYFGNLFQRMSSYLFGFLVFGITVIAFVGFAAVKKPGELASAWANPRLLIVTNVSATLAWAAYLTSVQLIEPAVAYTIGAGAMPLTAYVAHRFAVPEGEPMRNRIEAAGNVIILGAIIVLAGVTIAGQSGFVRGGAGTAIAGVMFAVADGALFTWMLIYCQRLGRAGVGPGTVFGLRFPLYVLVAGVLAASGADDKGPLASDEIPLIVIIGLALVIPPLFALQKAVAVISTMTIGALTALGPFIIFTLQMVEGRVGFAPAVLAALFIYFAGALLSAFGALKATLSTG